MPVVHSTHLGLGCILRPLPLSLLRLLQREHPHLLVRLHRRHGHHLYHDQHRQQQLSQMLQQHRLHEHRDTCRPASRQRMQIYQSPGLSSRWCRRRPGQVHRPFSAGCTTRHQPPCSGMGLHRPRYSRSPRCPLAPWR